VTLSKFKSFLLKPVIIYLTADIAVKGMQFLLMPTASHLLDITEYAKLTLFLALITAMAPIISLSSEAAFSIFFNQKFGDNRQKLFVHCALVALTGYLFFISTVLILSYVDDNLIFKIVSLKSDVTKIFTIVFIDYFINVSLLSTRLSFKSIKYFIWFVTCFAAKFIFGITSIYYFKNADVYLNCLLVVNVIFALMIVNHCFGLRDIFKQLKLVSFENYKRVLKYSFIILPVSIFAVVNSLVDKAYISSLLSVEDLASYSSIFLLAGSIQIFVLAMNKAYMPELLRLYSEFGYDALDNMKGKTKRLLSVNLFLFTLCIVVLPMLFKIMFSDYIYFDYDVFVILSLNFLFNSLYILFTNVLSLEEKTAKYKMFGFLLALVINLPLGYVLTLNFGVFGAALSTMLSTLSAAAILFSIVSFKICRFYLFKEIIIFLSLSLSLSLSFSVLMTSLAI